MSKIHIHGNWYITQYSKHIHLTMHIYTLYFKHNCKFLDKDTINKITKYQDICISLIDIIAGDKHAYKLLDNGKWECLVNINIKNYKRFLKYNIDSLDDYIYKDDLYIEKARHLLSKILYEKSIEWWD